MLKDLILGSPTGLLKLATFEKTADIHYGKEGPVVSAGLFFGADEGHEERHAHLQTILATGTSLNQIREEYHKKYPNDYSTIAIRRLGPKPNTPLFASQFHKEERDDHAHLSSLPKLRVITRIGTSGGDDQFDFYHSVRRGKDIGVWAD